MKRCPKCATWKPRSDYHKSRNEADGLQTACKDCRKAMDRSSALSAARYERYRAGGGREKQALWRMANPRMGRGKDPETREWVKAILADPCSYCGGPLGEGRYATVDHITPRDDGGPDHWENLTPACKSCNSAKRTKPLIYFLATRHGCWHWRQDLAA